MGNCQAVDAAALVIQHPSGKIERMYWSVTASHIMKTNPGHYVSLIIPLPGSESRDDFGNKIVRFTRVKLLRPTDLLVLGRAYRLVTSHDVMKVLRAKQEAKRKNLGLKTMAEKDDQVIASERRMKQRAGSFSGSKSWRPSLKSISEAVVAG